LGEDAPSQSRLLAVVIKSGVERRAICWPPRPRAIQWQAELRDGEIKDVPAILPQASSRVPCWQGAEKQTGPGSAKQAVMVFSTPSQMGRPGEETAAVLADGALVTETSMAAGGDMDDHRAPPRGYHGQRATLGQREKRWGVAVLPTKSIRPPPFPTNRQTSVKGDA